jgi:hypothetical protein
MRLFDLCVWFRVVHNLKEEAFDLLSPPRCVIKKHLEYNDTHRPYITFIGIVVFG